MPHCAVIWCTNQSRNVNKKNNGVSYHKFPQDPYIKDKWIRATGKCNWFPQKHDSVCSEHFDDDSFMKKASKTYLFLDAIPTLKLHPMFDEIDSLTNTIDFAKTPAPTPSKRRKKKNPPDLAAERIKAKSHPYISPEILIKEESPDTAPENHLSDEGAPDSATTLRIKEADPSDIVTEIQITEEEAPDLATAVHIEREDPLALTEIIVEVPCIEPPKESRSPHEACYTININDSPQTRHLKRSLKAAQDTIRRERLQVKRFRESNRRLNKKVGKMENIIKCLLEQSTDK